MALRFVVVFALMGLHAAQAANWDGGGGQGNFSWWDNWYDNNLSIQTFNSSTPLYFHYNNSGHTTLTQDSGYKTVQQIRYESTYSGSTTLGGSDGFDLHWKVENHSAGTQTINVPLVVQGTAFELNPIAGDLTVGGSINNYLHRSLDVYGSAGKTLTLNSTFSGSGANLTVKQNSVVLLNGSQTYTGDSIIDAGSIQLGAADRISNSSDLIVNSGGTMNLNSFNETVQSLSLASGGTLSLGTGDLTLGSQGGATWAGTISGSAGSAITKIGDGTTVSITGNNSFSGDFYVDGGTVGFNHNNAIGSAGTIHVGVNGGAFASTADISVNGVNVAADIVVESGAGARTLDIGGSGVSATFSGDITLNKDLNVTAGVGESMTVSGAISGSSKLVKGQGGTVTLSGNSGYTGNTEIDDGTLVVSGDLSGSSHVYLGNGGNVFSTTLQLAGSGASLGSVTVNTSAGDGTRTLNVTAGSQSIAGTVSLNRDLAVNVTGGSLDLNGTVNLSNSGNNDLSVAGSGNVNLAGTLSAATGNSDVNKSGAGTLTLSGNNGSSFYRLNIAGGQVDIASTAAFGSQSASFNDKVNFTGSGTLGITGNATLNGNMGFRVGSGQTGTFDVDNGVTFTVGGALANISGSGNFIKTGAGTMVLSGSSSYSGSMTVNQGVLDVQGSLTPSAGFSVSGTGQLTGDGTVGSLSIGSGGVLSPGNSPGTLNAGATTWASGGSYLWEINDVDAGAGTDPGWDLLNVSGALNITATAGSEFTIDVTSLTLANAAGAVHDFNNLNSYSWVIASASGGIVGFDASDFLIDTSGFQNPNSLQWSIQQTGNNIELVYTAGAPQDAVPEPSVVMLMTSALAIGFGLRRRIRIA